MFKKFRRLIAVSLMTCMLVIGLIITKQTTVQAIAFPWSKIAWSVSSYLNNYFYNLAPTIVYGSYYNTISTGTKNFNSSSSNVGASIYHDFDINKSNLEIDVWAETNFMNWLDKISIIVTDNSGYDRINRSVTHGQHTYYTPSYSDPWGSWRVRYVENDSSTWNCWLTVADMDAAPAYTTAMSIDEAGYKTYSNIVKTQDKIYAIPDSKHKDKITKMGNKTLSMKEISQQFYDTVNQRYVYSLKNYSIGDNLVFQDLIKKVEYNVENNATYFVFNGLNQEEVTWVFANNLTNKYKPGDKLNLKLNVVEEFKTSEDTFENLDYIVNSLKLHEYGNFANINDYQ